MRQIITEALRRVGHLFTIGWVMVSLVLMAVPVWAVDEQKPATGTDQAVVREPVQTDDTVRAAPRHRTESSDEQRALDQKPNLSDQVKLRVETYTGNEY